MKIYATNGVLFIGHWVDANDPKIDITLLAYRDENHYKNFVETMKSDPIYQKYETVIVANREKIEVRTLRLSESQTISIDESLLQDYLDEVKGMSAS